MGLQGSTTQKRSVSGQIFHGEQRMRQYDPVNFDGKGSNNTGDWIVRGIGA